MKNQCVKALLLGACSIVAALVPGHRLQALPVITELEGGGFSVAISGDTALIGNAASAPYVFVRDSARNWSLQQVLTASDEGYSGWAVAISGDTAVVGAPNRVSRVDSLFFPPTGEGFAFRRDAAIWSELPRFQEPSGDRGRGTTVGISEDADTVVMGSPFRSAHVVSGLTIGSYDEQELLLIDENGSLIPGPIVAVSGATALVTGDRSLDSVAVFARIGGVWTRSQTLTADSAPSSFGWAMAISGNTVLVGSPGDSGDTGSAYVFEQVGGGLWNQAQTLTAIDATAPPGMRFGNSVAISGDWAVVGTEFGEAAYLFVRSAGVWGPGEKLTVNDANAFGKAVAVSGHTALIGAGSSAFVFDFDAPQPVVYSWSGVLQPINADGSSVFKAESTVPVKFQLTGDSAGVTDAVARLSYAKLSNSVPGPVNEAVSTSAATTDNLFRYSSGQYLFNWSTKELSNGSYRLTIDLSDGVSRTVIVALR